MIEPTAFTDGNAVRVAARRYNPSQFGPHIRHSPRPVRDHVTAGRWWNGGSLQGDRYPLDRIVAVKILSQQIADDTEWRARFDREARAVALLDPPHICAVYDVGKQDDVHYLVMQYLEGETLAARLARTKGPLPLPQVLTIGAQIADALEKTHKVGLTHRDLKPANVMLTKSGPRLLDFGLAKITGLDGPISMSGMTRLATGPPLTAVGAIVGTVHYMAPEQVEGREADGRTDVWALGALLYEMATGQRPFDGDSAASVIGAILKDVPPPISTRAPLIPSALDHVVERCLAKDPDERWQSAADVGLMLRWIASSGGEQPARRREPHRAWREVRRMEPRGDPSDGPGRHDRSAPAGFSTFVEKRGCVLRLSACGWSVPKSGTIR